MNFRKCTLLVALTCAAQLSFAQEEEDDPGVPIVGKPVIPVLPAPGTWARASASRTLFMDCADYGYNTGVYIDTTDPISGSALTVGCTSSVYDRNDSQDTSSTSGQWARAGANATRSSAQSNLLGQGNVLNLKAEARSSNTRDVVQELRLNSDANLNPVDWSKTAGSGFGLDVARLVGETDSYSSSSYARLSDRFVADGTGRLVFEFRADGLYERGGGLPGIMPTGGRVSFAAVLLDPTGLQEFDLGEDFGTVRIWQDGSIASTGFALGRDSRDSPFTISQFPDGELLLGSEDLHEFAPRSSDVPSDELPTSPTLVQKDLTLALDVVEGKEYWLIAGLFTSATGWNPCDTMPGDGRIPAIGTTVDLDEEQTACGAGGTDVDFTSTVELSAVTFEGGLLGLQTASGVDYRLAVTAPIPLPPALWLMGAGLTVLAGRLRGMRSTRRAR